MKCQFSESQYCLGLGRELLEVLSPSVGWGPPYLPTQRDEANSGFDFSLQGPIKTLFIQFKVPEKLTRSNAKYWNHFNGPYYRTKIMKETDSNQHNLLVRLAEDDVRNNVIYSSPIFHKQSEFTNYYSSNTIMENSVAIDCRGLSEISGDTQHYFAYNVNPDRCYMFSKPKEIEGQIIKKYILKAQESEPYDDVNDFIESITSIFDKDEIDVGENEKTQDKIIAISEFLAIQKNIFMYLF